MLSAVLRGFLLGFVIALTPGPMFFLCVTRTVRDGWRAGITTGLGIATADGVYAAIAAGGIGAVGAVLTGSESWLELGGGLALVLLGVRSLLPARRGGGRGAPGGAVGGYGSAVALTLSNPATIVSFAALFAILGVRSVPTVTATALGSLTWWSLLVASAHRLRATLGERARLLAFLSGCALVAFGVVAVGSALLR